MAEKASTLQQQMAPAGRGVLRFVSAASLFDGHDAAINMIRRLLQASGAEVVHLGHNRSVSDIVRAAIQEDADGIAVSSYQGGGNRYWLRFCSSFSSFCSGVSSVWKRSALLTISIIGYRALFVKYGELRHSSLVCDSSAMWSFSTCTKRLLPIPASPLNRIT
jgi:hypothetical protein